MVKALVYGLIITTLLHSPVEFKPPKPIGEFKITAYTAGYESCGKLPDHPLYGITATGTEVKENQTIASDWEVLPPGTRVYIDGFDTVFTVEDRGGAVIGRHIDIYMEDLDDALKWGVREREVWLVE
jgi:3D (Asp-Asp-Asp) domain-containing protein